MELWLSGIDRITVTWAPYRHALPLSEIRAKQKVLKYMFFNYQEGLLWNLKVLSLTVFRYFAAEAHQWNTCACVL